MPSWQRALKAERKSVATRTSYTAGFTAFLRRCEDTGTAAILDKDIAQEFVNDLLDGGAEAATALARLKGVRRFSAWLTEERILATDPLLGMRSPKLDRKVVRALDEDRKGGLWKTSPQLGEAQSRDAITSRERTSILRLVAHWRGCKREWRRRSRPRPAMSINHQCPS